MLDLILGRSGFGKTKKIFSKISKLINEGKTKVMLLVPEQSSFETEKEVLNELGPIVANHIEVVNFTRLALLVNRKVGFREGKTLTPAIKNMLMSVAIENVFDELTIYKNKENKIELIELMVSALTEFKTCNIDYNILLQARDKVKNKTLKLKLEETAIILKSFEDLISAEYIDPLDDLTRLYNILQDENFFRDYTVFVDGFDGFNMQQLRIIEMILKQSQDSYISLCIDQNSLYENNVDLFFPIKKIVTKLRNFAKDNKIDFKEEYLENAHRFQNKGLEKIEKNIFRIKKEIYNEKIDDVVIFEANNVYEESDYVAKNIKRLVQEHGYRYKDFAIIYRTEESYKGIIDNALEKYDIPYFMDTREDIDYKPLMCLVLTALEAINNNFSSDSIFKYLKTGLAGLDTIEISKLENYTLLWGISGNAWNCAFKLSPSGIEEKKCDEDDLLELNLLREKVITPLVKLKQKTKNQNARNISMAIFEFLEEIKIKDNLQKFVQDLIKDGEKKIAEEQVRLWDLLMSLLDQVAVVLNNKKVNLDRFTKLFRLVVNSSDIAFIPKGLDNVIAGTVDRMRIFDVKVVFIMGASANDFPRTPGTAGIFSEKERLELLSLGLNMYDSLEGLAINERFLAYRALTQASEKMFITFPNGTVSGSSKMPSVIINEIREFLPQTLVLHKYSGGIEDEIWSNKNAFEICASHWNDKSRFSETLKKYFEDKDIYKDKLKSLMRSSSEIALAFENPTCAKSLFGQELNLSASQIEKYYKCKFSYFCQYGIQAKPRKKARFDALQYGNVIHFILENIFKLYSEEVINHLPKEELKEKIRLILDDYIDKTLKGLDDKSERFKYFFTNITNAVCPLIYHIANELSQSNFTPTDFELLIGGENKIPALKIKVNDSVCVNIRGKIDRVDTMKLGDKTYIRIIDYKTGDKEFDLSEIVYGINMQMLIYLIAVWKNGEKKYGDVLPAGVLYMPSKNSIIEVKRDTDMEKLEEQKQKKYRMNGLILNDKEIISSMEPGNKGLYIPVVLKDGVAKKLDNVANIDELKSIEKYIEKLICNMANELQTGAMEVNPLIIKDKDICDYCEYKTICKLESEDNCHREAGKLSRAEVFKKFEEVGGEL